MSILDQIIAHKHQEVALKKQLIPYSQLERSALFDRQTVSLSASIREGSGIIAEHKRRSPSKSVINNQVSVPQVVKGYEAAGASGLSILTDGRYFGGSLDDLLLARAAVRLPLLRKEFIVDEYQIVEAKAHGADAILLIAASLTKKQIIEFADLAKRLQLDVLCEAHNREEVEKSLTSSVDMIGINNRNLKTFEVSLETSKELAPHIPNDFVKVSESGISTPEAVLELRPYGYQGFLMGECFMKTEDPGASATEFINAIKR